MSTTHVKAPKQKKWAGLEIDSDDSTGLTFACFALFLNHLLFCTTITSIFVFDKLIEIKLTFLTFFGKYA